MALVRTGKPFARVAAGRALAGRNRSRTDPTAGRFTRADVAGIVDDAFRRFDDRVPGFPAEPTAGSRQNVALAALTLALLEALQHVGVERGYAIELTADTCWRFYRRWGQVTTVLAHLVSRDPARRLRWSVNAFLTYPFGRPGYRFDDVAEPSGRSLNMLRCPVADYLRRHGAADLAAGSWCELDYALADMWQSTLHRTGTLAAGARCCDFRFRTKDASTRGDLAGSPVPAATLMRQ